MRMRDKYKKGNGYRKAQHEIMGFVLIVVVVSVIGLVFLSLMIGRGEENKPTSVEISNLLEASMHYTTDCAQGFVNEYNPYYRDGQDLIKACYSDQIGNYLDCLDGRKVCDALDSNLRDVIGGSLRVSEESPDKAYKLNIYHSTSDEEIGREDILFIEEGVFGNCSSKPGGSHLIAVSDFSSRIINIELEVCKG